MDRRTRILGGVFLAFIVYALLSSVVYPRWIEPLLSIDGRIAERQEIVTKLEDGETEVDHARREYRQFLDRIGSLDPVKVENDLRERLNVLVEKHGLEDVTTSGGSARLNSLGKTDAEVMTLSVNATGTLAAALGFVKDLAELPHLIRLGNTAIYPASSSRKRSSKDRMYLRVPLEVLVLPRQRILDQRLTEEDLKRPESYVRHEGRPYSEIWERTPFTRFMELTANAGRDRTFDEGTSASLRGTATGGHGDFSCNWDPPEGLDDPSSCQPKLDTASTRTQEYVLTVKDARGGDATDTVTVTVQERVAEVEPPPDESKTTPKGPKRFKDGRQMQLCMALIRHEDDARLDEVLVYNSRSKETLYYQPGDEFDGGELVFVHPRGAVARRQNADGEDDLFIYPLGAKLTEDIWAQDANDHPKLQAAANRIRESLWSEPTDEQANGEAEQAAEAPTSEKTGQADESDAGELVKEPKASGRRGSEAAGADSRADKGSADGQEPESTESRASDATPDGDKKDEGGAVKAKEADKKDDPSAKRKSPTGSKAKAAEKGEPKPAIDAKAIERAREEHRKRRLEAKRREVKRSKKPGRRGNRSVPKR